MIRVEVVQTALTALARNRLRSVLTTLGIVIGVFALITIVAVGEGTQKMVADQLKTLGANRIMVIPGSKAFSGAHASSADVNSLTPDDAKAISQECPDVLYLAPTVRAAAPIVFGNLNWSTSIQGVNHLFPEVRDWQPERGRFFSESDVNQANKVCLVGRTTATRLFGTDDPIGKILRVKKMPFRVVGVMSSKGLMPWGADQDDVVIAPYTTVMKRITGTTYLSMIQVAARSWEVIDSAQEQITSVLRRRHRIQPGEDDDFAMRSQKDAQQMMDQTYGTIFLFLVSVASISLLVGGIGIMNIMLVSVTERIREIGIRLAVGARGRDILMQFLLEAVFLSMLGGLLGVLLGVGGAQIIAKPLRWPILINTASAVIGCLFSGLVGVVFGFVPAWRASQLDPIQALKQD